MNKESAQSIECVCTPVVCWAGEHCGIPLIRSCRITNTASRPLPEARVVIELVPNLGNPMSIPLPSLEEQAPCMLEKVDYRLVPGRLRDVTEWERGEFQVKLLSGEELVAEQRIPVEVLPSNHWPGLRMPPGMLASFITPNHPDVADLLKRTSLRLAATGGDGAIVGYQAKNPKMVRAQAMALCHAIQGLNLNYIGVPASFEESGQKVRFADRILAERMANCLDITLLCASCLEQMGLRSLVVLVNGHAFPGVWLVEDCFPEGAVEDAARLRNLVALGHILVWDSSAIVQKPVLTFTDVQAQGERHLEADEAFGFALDVRVMRQEKYLPLPLRQTGKETPNAASGGISAAPPDEELRDLLTTVAGEGACLDPEPVVQPSRVASRWQRWKERLLDLSLRNRLLNYRPQGNSALPLEVPDLPRFEDFLADNKVFEILPRPPLDSRDERDVALLAQRVDRDRWQAQRLADMDGRKLHSSLTPGELVKHARELEFLARADLEEGGVNTVFAAIGMLRWFEPGDPRERFAPLLLYPVQILFNRQMRRVCIQRLPEDPMVNVTLVEKMRRDCNVDLSFLVTLDPDDAGLDIQQMLRRSREAIQRMPGWEILAEAHIGHFTFAKFLMWKDLEDNADILMKNPVIRHLASEEGEAWLKQPPAVPLSTLDERTPTQLPCVVDADSTQLSAVASAQEKRSFVLQGPPGTGKSQTIANLIASTIANGRSVLFVSEKMAALEVVHARLRQAGLEDFCLELHSHKANRKEVLESFQRVLERVRSSQLEGLEARETEIKELRRELNALADALHRSRAIGFTLHRGLARMRELEDCLGMAIRKTGLSGVGEEAFRQFLRDVDDFASRAAALGRTEDFPWTGTEPASWTRQGQEAVEEQLAGTKEALAGLGKVLAGLDRDFRCPMPSAPEAIEALVSFLGMLDVEPLPEDALDAVAWAPVEDALEAHSKASREAETREKGLGSRWSPAFLGQDLGPLLHTYRTHAGAFPLFRWFSLWSSSKELRPMATQGLPDPLAVLKDLEEARAIQEEKQRLAESAGSLARRIEPVHWRSRQGLPVRAKEAQRKLALIQIHFSGNATDLGRALWRLPRDRRGALAGAWGTLRTREEALFRCLGIKPGHGPWDWGDEGHFQHLASLLESWVGGLGSFRAWCFYRESARKLEATGFAEVVEAHRKGLEPGKLVAAAERAFLERWWIALRDEEPALRGFDGAGHHRKVDRFRAVDRQWLQLSRQWVIKNLEGRLPAVGAAVSEASEMGLLLRQMKLKRGHMAIRKLLHSIPNLLPRLKPCLMMSPLSVAQYLPAEGDPFDLLVFDEASQITTHDAIGALARGRQIIVVGDSRQLPPTSFFSRNLDDETDCDDNDVVELESILDEAVAKQFPQQWLGWHYRSRHHTLIEFSNHHYYEGRLHVFPAAAWKVPDLGIAWHPVPEGVYFGTGCQPRTQERTNPVEAERLVDYLVQALRNLPAGARTFGIVTFSMAQQKLIQEMLDERRARYPEIEPHFQGPEGVFIKNLENVQGDERDEILFSIGYARDAKGKLRMHFGPLSLAGGERRLNVAITRARCQLRVFSTLTHDQIDLSRTSARGAEHLRAFLQFAARQGAPEAAVPVLVKHPDSLVNEVAQAVADLGHAVHSQVGCGGYRVDLAVLDPAQNGNYLLGIEMDGQAYGSAPTARDRDRLRHQVLTGLGWKLHRIWSLDWIENQAGELGRLKAALDEAVQSKVAVQVTQHPAPAQEPFGRPRAVFEGMTVQAPDWEGVPAECSAVSPQDGIPYKEIELSTVPCESPESFYLDGSFHDSRAQVLEVLKVEAPIHRDDLDGKIVRAWGWSALTRRGKAQMDLILKRMGGEICEKGHFVWRRDQDPLAFDVFRTPGSGGPRNAEGVAPEEIASAMAATLKANVAMEEEPLLRETARLLGYRRVTGKTLEALKAGLKPLVARKGFQVENGVYKQL